MCGVVVQCLFAFFKRYDLLIIGVVYSSKSVHLPTIVGLRTWFYDHVKVRVVISSRVVLCVSVSDCVLFPSRSVRTRGRTRREGSGSTGRS